MSAGNYGQLDRKIKQIDKTQRNKKATKAAALSIAGVLCGGYVTGQVMAGLLGLPDRGGIHFVLDTIMGSVILAGAVGLFFIVRQAFIDFWLD